MAVKNRIQSICNVWNLIVILCFRSTYNQPTTKSYFYLFKNIFESFSSSFILPILYLMSLWLITRVVYSDNQLTVFFFPPTIPIPMASNGQIKFACNTTIIRQVLYWNTPMVHYYLWINSRHLGLPSTVFLKFFFSFSN